MSVIKSLAPTDACCSSWPTPRSPQTERLDEPVYCPVLSCGQRGGKGEKVPWAPTSWSDTGQGAFHTRLRQEAGVRCPLRVWERHSHTHDNLCRRSCRGHVERAFQTERWNSAAWSWRLKDCKRNRFEKGPYNLKKEQNPVKGRNSKSNNSAVVFFFGIIQRSSAGGPRLSDSFVDRNCSVINYSRDMCGVPTLCHTPSDALTLENKGTERAPVWWRETENGLLNT